MKEATHGAEIQVQDYVYLSRAEVRVDKTSLDAAVGKLIK